jgi:diguanylate cyclase (GGDEF)-like protein
MKDPNDTRDIGPRAGSPLWIHITAVTVAGGAALSWAVLRLAGLRALAAHPLFWVLAALIVLGEIRPIITPGRTGSESPLASLTFSFATLLYWGFPVAALLRALSTLGVGLTQRRAVHRCAFNAAQEVLALGGAALVLAAAGARPVPAHPWVPVGGQLLVVLLAAGVYFVMNFVLVLTAVALHSRAPLIQTFRAALPYQAFVSGVLMSAAPLVTAVMARESAWLLLLFVLPLAAVYANAAMSVQREHQANHDELTGLSNRKLLICRTEEALEAARAGTKVGLLLLDLDRFKEVNDTLGHAVGDRLLGFVAYRLTHSVRPGDIVARLGGDEFAVLLPSVRDDNGAREVATRLRAALAEPIRLEGMSLDIEASVGMALYPEDATDFEQLLQHADVAMYLAKERRTGVERYLANSDRNSPARLALLGDLRRGMNRGELVLRYQPKVYLDDGSPAGMEALVRWQHPVRGLLMPEEFIPLVEQSYLMRDLTVQVIDTTLVQTAAWWADGLRVPVSLNIAARDLLDAGLAETIGRGLERYGLPPEAVLLEINERVLMSEPAHAEAAVEALDSLGVTLSIDDFGTGYSSLVRLKRLPVREVKIDASFVARMLDSADDEVIVRSIITMVSALGICSVAEGVESAETAAALRAMGCECGQGWYFGRPLTATAATTWLAGAVSADSGAKQFRGLTADRATGALGQGHAGGAPSQHRAVGCTGAAGQHTGTPGQRTGAAGQRDQPGPLRVGPADGQPASRREAAASQPGLLAPRPLSPPRSAGGSP